MPQLVLEFADGREIFADMNILAANCIIFRHLFEDSSRKSPVHVPERITREAFLKFYDIITPPSTANPLNETNEGCASLWLCADYFDVPWLMDLLERKPRCGPSKGLKPTPTHCFF